MTNISVTNENGYCVISDNSDKLCQVKISNVNEDIYYDDRTNNANYVSNTITYDNSYNKTYYDIFNDVFGYEYNKNLLQLI